MEEVRELKDGEIGNFYYSNGDIGFYTKHNLCKIIVGSNNFIHNINDEPSITYLYGDLSLHQKHWYKHGILHRLNGPSWIKYHKGHPYENEYWIEGKSLSQQEFEIEKNRLEMLNELQ